MNTMVFEKTDFERESFEIPETCEEFETVNLNPQRFRKTASNGTVSISLMRQHFELGLKEISTFNSQTIYAGYIIGGLQSSIVFEEGNDTINGWINADFCTLSYGIVAMEKKRDGKIVHLVCRYYGQVAEELDPKFSSDPLVSEFSPFEKLCTCLINHLGCPLPAEIEST